MSFSSSSALVLVRADRRASSSSSRTLSTFAQEGTGAVLFNAQHGQTSAVGEVGTVLFSGRTYLGTVSLGYINVGSGDSRKEDKFYRMQGWFSKGVFRSFPSSLPSRAGLSPAPALTCHTSRKRLFRLGQTGIWASWENSQDDASMQLIDNKSKAILAAVSPVDSAADQVLPSKTSITFSPALASLLFAAPAQPSPLPSSSSASSSSSSLPSAPSSPTTSTPPLSLPLVLVLLTWLHQDYLRAEAAQGKANREQEKEDERDQGFDAF